MYEILLLIGFIIILIIPVIWAAQWVSKSNIKFFKPYFNLFAANRPRPNQCFKAIYVRVGKRQWGTFFPVGEEGDTFYIRIPSVDALWIPYKEMKAVKVLDSSKERVRLKIEFKQPELTAIEFIIAMGALAKMKGLWNKAKEK